MCTGLLINAVKPQGTASNRYKNSILTSAAILWKDTHYKLSEKALNGIINGNI